MINNIDDYGYPKITLISITNQEAFLISVLIVLHLKTQGQQLFPLFQNISTDPI